MYICLDSATVAFSDGTGRRLGDGAQFMAQFFSGFIMAFTQNWQLSLVLVSGFPVIGCATYFLTKVTFEVLHLLFFRGNT